METEILAASSVHAMDRALQVLTSGGLVGMPTDTVYGLAALAFDAEAAQALYVAKERPAERAIPILLGEAGWISQVCIDVSPKAVTLAARFWPGPLTLVLLKRPSIPDSVSPYKTVAVRVPNHPVALALLRAAGPLAVTSANLAGKPATRSAVEVEGQLSGRIQLILDGGRTPGGQPSTIVDCTQDDLVILRPGPISLSEMQAELS